MTKRFGKDYKKKKVIKVTVIYKHKKYTEAKVVDKSMKVTSNDVNLSIGDGVEININVDGIKLDKKDIDNL